MDNYEFLISFLEEKNPTPSYIFDINLLLSRLENIKKVLGKRAEICYAMKANPFLIRAMEKQVKIFEVCSPGEFRICERMEIPMEEIVLSGVYKNPEDIQGILGKYHGKGIYTAESLEQLRILNEKAVFFGVQIKVLLRVSSGNQFGMDEEEICKILAKREQYTGICFAGLQFYSGTQKKNLSQMEKELQSLDELLEKLLKEYEYEAEILEYGPGFFASYFAKEKEESVDSVLKEFGSILDKLTFKGKIILEMGRFLTYLCGYYLTSIVDLKKNNGENFAIVDGGVHHLNYYGQTMAMKIPYCRHLDSEGNMRVQGEETGWNICGSLCTVNDVIVKRLQLKKPMIHDILVFERVGAYSVTEGMYLFLSRPMPKIYFWEDNRLKLVRDELYTDEINSERR